MKQTWKDIEIGIDAIAPSIKKFNPEYIVGVSDGGRAVATLLGAKISTHVYSHDLNLKDPNYSNTTVCWMAEDASNEMRILLVLDHYDEDMIEWIKKDWDSSVFKEVLPYWNKTVKVATITAITGTNTSPDFVAYTYEGGTQCRFPWSST